MFNSFCYKYSVKFVTVKQIYLSTLLQATYILSVINSIYLKKSVFNNFAIYVKKLLRYILIALN